MIDVVITGLFREKSLFEESLKIFKSLDEIDLIIFSTWKNHLKKNDKIFLEKYNVTIIENEPMIYSGPGNIYSQMKSLDIGLRNCKNNHVLKTRSDILIKKELLIKIITKKPMKIENGIFKEKIWTYWFDLTTPFYMSEEAFYGHIEDVKKLVNYDDTFDEIWQYQAKRGYGGATHQRRYVHPFINEFTLEDWINRKTLIKKYDKNHIMREFEHDDFIEIISKYYYILNKYFWIYNPNFEVINKGKFGSVNFCKINFDHYDQNLTPSKMIIRDIIICNDTKLITKLINNEYFGIATNIYKKIKKLYDN